MTDDAKANSDGTVDPAVSQGLERIARTTDITAEMIEAMADLASMDRIRQAGVSARFDRIEELARGIVFSFADPLERLREFRQAADRVAAFWEDIDAAHWVGDLPRAARLRKTFKVPYPSAGPKFTPAPPATATGEVERLLSEMEGGAPTAVDALVAHLRDRKDPVTSDHALSRAIVMGNQDAVIALLDAGARPEARVARDTAPEMLEGAGLVALAAPRPTLMRLLLDRGAPPDLCDAKGRLPLDFVTAQAAAAHARCFRRDKWTAAHAAALDSSAAILRAHFSA